MDISKIAAALKKGLETMEALAPLAVLGGPAAAGIGSIAATLADIGQNVLDKIEDGAVVASSDDKEQVKALLAQIQAENDTLAARIRSS